MGAETKKCEATRQCAVCVQKEDNAMLLLRVGKFKQSVDLEAGLNMSFCCL